jgi:hypothetical protein
MEVPRKPRVKVVFDGLGSWLSRRWKSRLARDDFALPEVLWPALALPLRLHCLP